MRLQRHLVTAIALLSYLEKKLGDQSNNAPTFNAFDTIMPLYFKANCRFPLPIFCNRVL
jgi:hypothetical protein